MKKEELERFKKLYNMNIDRITNAYSEIERLQNELDNDPRKLEIEKLEEELQNDPRRIKIQELSEQLYNDPRNNKIYGLKNLLSDYEIKKRDQYILSLEEYAYIKTFPKIIDAKNTYGILVRFGPFLENKEYLPFEEIPENNPNTKIVYLYTDIENPIIQTSVYDNEINEFELNHKVIHASDTMCHYAIQKEFYTLLLESMDPEIAYKTMVEKYNTNNKTKAKKF